MASVGCTCTCTDDVWVAEKKQYKGCMENYHCGRRNKGCNFKRHGTGHNPIPFF